MRFLIPVTDTGCTTVAWIALVGSLVAFFFALFRDRARGRPRCPRCWYDLRAIGTIDAGPPGEPAPVRCPECGHQTLKPSDRLRTRRRWAWSIPGLVLIVYSVALFCLPDVRAHGWAHRFPTWAVVRMWPGLDRPAGISQVNSDDRPVFIELLQRFNQDAVSDADKRILGASCFAELERSRDRLERRDAYWILSRLGPGYVPASQAIAFFRTEQDPQLQARVRQVMVRCASDDPEVRVLIAEHLRQDSADLGGLVSALPEQGEAAIAYVPLLVELMGAGENATGAGAAWKLMVLGGLASSHLAEIETIAGAARDPGFRAVYQGAAACVRGDFESDAACCASLLDSPDPNIRALGAWQLSSWQVRQRGLPFTDRLIAALQNPRADDLPFVEDRLIEALRLQGKRALKAIPVLERLATRPGLDPKIAERIRFCIESIRRGE